MLLETEVLYCKEMEAESCKEMEAGCCMDVVGWHLYCKEMEEHCVMLGLLDVHQVLQMLALCEMPRWNKTHTLNTSQ